jgi:hypothetical protein
MRRSDNYFVFNICRGPLFFKPCEEP